MLAHACPFGNGLYAHRYQAPSHQQLTGGVEDRVSSALAARPRQRRRVEVAAYYVVSEALTNAAKYAQASLVDVSIESDSRVLRLRVRDDGVGGADPIRGSGLIGLKDRVEALGGTMTVHSPVGAGTRLGIELPLDA